MGGDTTDKMDIDTLPPPTNKPTLLATTPLANTSNATPTPARTSRAFELHGIACSEPWTQKYRRLKGHLGEEGEG